MSQKVGIQVIEGWLRFPPRCACCGRKPSTSITIDCEDALTKSSYRVPTCRECAKHGQRGASEFFWHLFFLLGLVNLMVSVAIGSATNVVFGIGALLFGMIVLGILAKVISERGESLAMQTLMPGCAAIDFIRLEKLTVQSDAKPDMMVHVFHFSSNEYGSEFATLNAAYVVLRESGLVMT